MHPDVPAQLCKAVPTLARHRTALIHHTYSNNILHGSSGSERDHTCCAQTRSKSSDLQVGALCSTRFLGRQVYSTLCYHFCCNCGCVCKRLLVLFRVEGERARSGQNGCTCTQLQVYQALLVCQKGCSISISQEIPQELRATAPQDPVRRQQRRILMNSTLRACSALMMRIKGFKKVWYAYVVCECSVAGILSFAHLLELRCLPCLHKQTLTHLRGLSPPYTYSGLGLCECRCSWRMGHS